MTDPALLPATDDGLSAKAPAATVSGQPSVVAGRRLPFIDVPGLAILVAGIGIGLLVAAALFQWSMSPPVGTLAHMGMLLATYAFVSAGAGFLLYLVALKYSRRLDLTLTLAFVLAALVALYIVWQMAQLMFISPDDLVYTSIFLIFAAVIAVAFGISATRRVTHSLRSLIRTTRRVAAGDLSARAPLVGRDEVAQLTRHFNLMATQLENAARQRDEVEALRRDLIAWASHDLRTPLTSVRAMVEALHDGLVNDDETRERYYRTIRADIIGLNQLIDDLFELSQLDSGGLKLAIHPASLSDLISDSIESFHALATQRAIQLVGQVEENVDPVPLNPQKVSRLLTNLLGNALRHTPTGGIICVLAQRDARQVVVTVRDSGPGFPEADLARIFEKFYRGEQARSRATGGAGLGLAIARGIVQAHGGEIWASNAPEGGAIVGFTLPEKAATSPRDR